MIKNKYPTSEQLKATEGYEDQSRITGDRTAMLMAELMKGTDVQTAVASLTAGGAGHSPEMVTNLAHLRSELLRLRLERIESSVDENGRNALERFETNLSRMISERLISNIEIAEKQRLGYHAQLVTEIMEYPDDEFTEYTHRHLQALFDGKIIQPKPIEFITDYKSFHGSALLADSEGELVRENDLLETAIMEAAVSRDGSFDEECADALDGLLPSKLSMSIASNGVVSIRVDGTELSVPISGQF